MGRQPSDAVLDTVDFEGSGNYAGAPNRPGCEHARVKGQITESAGSRPQFRAGETTLQMRLVGKVKFK